MIEWVLCVDMMPEPLMCVLIVHDGGVYIAYWGGGRMWWREKDSVPGHEVIHWMPLPEVPS